MRLQKFIRDNYTEEAFEDMEETIKVRNPDFNNQESSFDWACAMLFYSLIGQYLEHPPQAKQTPRTQTQPVNHDGTEAFHKTYQKEMPLASFFPGIKTEIWKEIDRIINACEEFKNATAALFSSIDFLDKAKADNDQAKFISHFPTYKERREETEKCFKSILQLWGILHKTYSHVKEIKQIVQINFAKLVAIPPDNRMIHVAGDCTDAFIEKLRKLAEDYLFM